MCSQQQVQGATGEIIHEQNVSTEEITRSTELSVTARRRVKLLDGPEWLTERFLPVLLPF
jgi:hypothetical protein